MKTFKNISLTLLVIVGLMGCSQVSFDEPTIKKGEKIESTTTISELMSNYMVSPDLFTADPMDAGEPLVINGVVTSTDIEGNVYKYIAVQELFDDGTKGNSIRISIDASGISSLYPIGQRVSVTLNDLYIGKYGESPQIGIYYKRPSDARVSPGAIPMPIARQKIIPYGNADKSLVVADTMTIAQIIAAPRESMHYRLVCIKNAWFTGKGFSFGSTTNLSSADQIFAPGTNGIGFPQSREIQDGTTTIGIPVATSEYARFAQQKLPATTYKGDITVIVAWYRSSNTGNYQLTLRTLGDLGTGFDGYLNSIGYTRK